MTNKWHTKKDYERIIKNHVDPKSDRLSNYHAVCMALGAAAEEYGMKFGDLLVNKYELEKRGITPLCKKGYQ
jgi:hypothetical protein